MLKVKSNPPFRKKQLHTSNISFQSFFLSFIPTQSAYKIAASLQVTEHVEQSQPSKYNGFNKHRSAVVSALKCSFQTLHGN